MTGPRTPGPLGREPTGSDSADQLRLGTTLVGRDDIDAEALAGGAKITEVTHDWSDPPTPTVAETPEVSGKTLQDVAAALGTDEWGSGGGGFQYDYRTDNGKDYVVKFTGTFQITLPKWLEYGSATVKQKAAWDAMITNLRAHEDEHVAIHYRALQKLVKKLDGLPFQKLASEAAATRAETKAAHKAFDTSTDHGAKAFGNFKKVELDLSADPPPKPAP